VTSSAGRKVRPEWADANAVRDAGTVGAGPNWERVRTLIGEAAEKDHVYG